MKYEPDWAKGREDVPRTAVSDGQSDHYRAPAEQGPNKTYMSGYVTFNWGVSDAFFYAMSEYI